MYDYTGHLKQFGFDWIQNNLGLRYGIRINNSNSKKIKKQLTLSRSTRKKKLFRWVESLEHVNDIEKKWIWYR